MPKKAIVRPLPRNRPILSDEEKKSINLPVLTERGQSILLPPEGIEITQYNYRLEPRLHVDVLAMGYDPGQVHMGLAWVRLDTAMLYEIKMPTYTDAVERIMAITTCLQYVQALHPPAVIAVAEGASFLAAYGQVPLAEARTTGVIAILTAGVPQVMISPPRQIRKAIFGKAEIRSQEMWPEIPENASSALGCAFYAYKLAREERIQQEKPK